MSALLYGMAFPVSWIPVIHAYWERHQRVDLARLTQIVLLFGQDNVRYPQWGKSPPRGPEWRVLDRDDRIYIGPAVGPEFSRTDVLVREAGKGAPEALKVLYDYVQTIPEEDRHLFETALAELLRRAVFCSWLENRGLSASSDGSLRVQTGKRGQPRIVFHEIARELYDYLKPFYEAGWPDGTTNPKPLREHIAQLLRPAYREVSDQEIQTALKNRRPN